MVNTRIHVPDGYYFILFLGSYHLILNVWIEVFEQRPRVMFFECVLTALITPSYQCQHLRQLMF